MTVNPNGAVQVNDFGNPRTITLRAASYISGGQLVYASGAAGNVGSGADSLAGGDIAAVASASGGQFTGIALQDSASGDEVAVAVQGAFIVSANGSVTTGQTVITDGNDSVQDGTTAGKIVGRALTSATSGGFAVVEIGKA